MRFTAARAAAFCGTRIRKGRAWLGSYRRALLETHELQISPEVLLELEFLREIGRTKVPSTEIVAALSSSIGLTVADVGLGAVVAAASRHPWTRDPFDRMIVGTAAALGQRLLTADRSIRKHFADAVWR